MFICRSTLVVFIYLEMARIVNMSFSFTLGTEVSIDLLCEFCLEDPNVLFLKRTKNFTSATIRLKKPQVSTLVFPNGKVVLIGATSIKDAEKASLKISNLITSLGYDAVVESFKLNNVVGAYNLGHRLDLRRFYQFCKDSQP